MNQIMKKNLFFTGLLALMMLLSGKSWGQTTIFTESIGTVSGTTTIAAHEAANGFDNDDYTMTGGGATNPADIRVTNVSSGYTGASGAANVFFTSTNAAYGFAIEGIDASAFTTLKVQFGYRKESASALPTLVLDYWNGSTYVNVPFSFNEAANASIAWYLSPEILLPAGAQIENLKLRWVKSGSNSVRIDDVKLTGIPSSSHSITTGIVSTSPFCVTASTGAAGTVAYTSSGDFEGTFTAQLSDATGSFAAPVSIGTGDSPISIAIPAGTVSGTGYKIRVVNDDPETTGTESTAFEVINGAKNVSGATAGAGYTVSILGWTNPTGCYDEIMIVAKASSAVSASPSGDGSAYSANLAFSSGTEFDGGYVVYKGISSPQTVTGLTNGTTYFYTFFTRNGTIWSNGTTISQKAGLLPVIWTFEPLLGTNANPTANTGNGTASVIGSMTTPGTATGMNTTTGCGAQITGTLAWAIGVANPGATNESSGVQFLASTQGETNIVFQFEQRWSNTSTNTIRVQYTTNGTDWTNFEMNEINTSYCSGELNNGRFETNTTGDNFRRIIVDFSDIPAVNNNPNFGVRVVAAHYRNTGQFRQVTTPGSTATAGTWRFDNVQVYSRKQYYSKNSGALNVPNTWGLNTDGSGDEPLVLTDGGQVFNLSNRTNETISSSITLRNLDINSGVVLEIANNGSLTALGTLTNSAGSAGLVIESDATGTGSLIHNTDNVPATMQRYITGSTDLLSRYYHHVSIPLNNSVQSSQFSGSYLFSFNQATQTWNQITQDNVSLNNNQGYMIFYPNTETTYNFVGQLNNGAFVASTTTDAIDEYSLVPNPYPSAIDWDAATGWTKTNLLDAIWIWNPVAQNYAAYGTQAGTNGGSRYIAPGQAFFVKSSAASPVLSMNNNVRLHNAQAFFNTPINNQMLRVRAEANGFSDEAIVRFHADASLNYEANLDVDKLRGNEAAPQLFTLASDMRELSINTVPFATETFVMPLAFESGFEGEVVFSFSELNSFEEGATIFLEDKTTGEMINLQEQQTYSFMHNQSNDPDRFNLHFFGVTGIDMPEAKSDYHIWSRDRKVYVNIPELNGQQAQIEMFDVLGNKLFSSEGMMNSPAVVRTMNSGVAIIRVTSQGRVYTTKLFIQ
jgi:hypothetical protein